MWESNHTLLQTRNTVTAFQRWTLWRCVLILAGGKKTGHRGHWPCCLSSHFILFVVVLSLKIALGTTRVATCSWELSSSKESILMVVSSILRSRTPPPPSPLILLPTPQMENHRERRGDERPPIQKIGPPRMGVSNKSLSPFVQPADRE